MFIYRILICTFNSVCLHLKKKSKRKRSIPDGVFRHSENRNLAFLRHGTSRATWRHNPDSFVDRNALYSATRERTQSLPIAVGRDCVQKTFFITNYCQKE